jgi:hypothetical protein
MDDIISSFRLIVVDNNVASGQSSRNGRGAPAATADYRISDVPGDVCHGQYTVRVEQLINQCVLVNFPQLLRRRSILAVAFDAYRELQIELLQDSLIFHAEIK